MIETNVQIFGTAQTCDNKHIFVNKQIKKIAKQYAIVDTKIGRKN